MRIRVKAASLRRRLELAALIARSHGERGRMLDDVASRREWKAYEELRKNYRTYFASSFSYPMPPMMPILREYGAYAFTDSATLSNQVRLVDKSDDWVELDESELALVGKWLDTGFAKHPSNQELGYV